MKYKPGTIIADIYTNGDVLAVVVPNYSGIAWMVGTDVFHCHHLGESRWRVRHPKEVSFITDIFLEPEVIFEEENDTQPSN